MNGHQTNVLKEIEIFVKERLLKTKGKISLHELNIKQLQFQVGKCATNFHAIKMGFDSQRQTSII